MFDSIKAMTLLANLARNKDELIRVAERLKTEAVELRAEGRSGAGAVVAIADGRMRIVDVRMSPAVAAAAATTDADQARSLVADAVNDAIRNAQIAMRDIANREAEALGLPSLPDDLGGLIVDDHPHAP